MIIHKRVLRRAIPGAILAASLVMIPMAAFAAPDAGGAFKDTNSGSYATTGGNCLTTSCTVTLTGKGKASFLGPVNETGTISGTACKPSTGNATLTSQKNSANSVSASVSGMICLSSTGQFTINLKYTITGGTGAFAKATGSGVITGTATCCPPSGTYTDHWKGTLHY